MRTRPALLTLALAVLVLAGCESSAQTPTQTAGGGGKPSPFDYFPTGSTGDYVLNTHCGLEFVPIDGMTWRTKPRSGTNAPEGWGDLIHGNLSRPSFRRAVFAGTTTETKRPIRVVFRPAPHISWQCS